MLVTDAMLAALYHEFQRKNCHEVFWRIPRPADRPILEHLPSWSPSQWIHCPTS